MKNKNILNKNNIKFNKKVKNKINYFYDILPNEIQNKIIKISCANIIKDYIIKKFYNKYGFKWTDKEIPKKWLTEKKKRIQLGTLSKWK